MRGMWAIALLTVACDDGGAGGEQEAECFVFGHELVTDQSAEQDCTRCTCVAAGQLRCEPSCPADARAAVAVEPDGGPPADAAPGPRDGAPPDAPPVAARCEDLDDDGFEACDDPTDPRHRDCDDERWSSQPGGADFPGNGLDDDCDGAVDETVGCGCPVGEGLAPRHVLRAIGLCGDAVGDTLQMGSPLQTAVDHDFFGIAPRSGECLAVLATGLALQNDPQNALPRSELFFPDPDPAGGFADVFDLVSIAVDLRPPPNARGFRFDFMFVTTEWPEFLCQEFNDTFYAVVSSAAINDGARTNVSFDRAGHEVSVNVGFFEVPARWTVPLGGTPYGAPDGDALCPFDRIDPRCEFPDACQDPAAQRFVGSGTGWLTSQGPIAPREPVVNFTFSIHDEGDPVLDSAVLLDRFEWLPDPVAVGTTKR